MTGIVTRNFKLSNFGSALCIVLFYGESSGHARVFLGYQECLLAQVSICMSQGSQEATRLGQGACQDNASLGDTWDSLEKDPPGAPLGKMRTRHCTDSQVI